MKSLVPLVLAFVVAVVAIGLVGCRKSDSNQADKAQVSDQIDRSDVNATESVEGKPASAEEGTKQTEKKNRFHPADYDGSPSAQADRLKFIQKMFRMGYWEKTEVFGSSPAVWITPTFLLPAKKLQNKTLGVAYAYWMGELDDFGLTGPQTYLPLQIKMDKGTVRDQDFGAYDPTDGIQLKN